MRGHDQPDIDGFDLPSGREDDYACNLFYLVFMPNSIQFKRRRAETGLTKPPLILGLPPTHSLGISLSMTTDIMHLVINLSNLLLSLWRGTMDIMPSDDIMTWTWAVLHAEATWQEHSKAIAQAGPFLPGLYDHCLRNIAEKLCTFRLQNLGIPIIHLWHCSWASLQCSPQ